MIMTERKEERRIVIAEPRPRWAVLKVVKRRSPADCPPDSLMAEP
jgi:hypothetical protein